MNKKQKKVFTRIIISTLLIIFTYVTDIPLLFLVPYIIIGYDILIKAAKGLINRQPFDENFLMAVATIGAIILGEHAEGCAVMLFYQIGELFQSYAVGKSRKSISSLMDIRPDYANIERDGKLLTVTPDSIDIGTVIIIKTGEKIPIDGIVIDGNATINTSALTGESIPLDITVGDEVASGCINMNGLIKIKTTATFGDSTASKILDLVESASSRKSRSENFISKFAKYYTPAVCVTALILAMLPPLFSGNWGVWLYRALTFLVISCPCALVISVPLGFFAAIGGAGREGILIKGSNYIEILSKVKTVAFDKTGTLTKGKFEVTKIHCVNGDEQDILCYAAHAECYSSHPISESIRQAYRKTIDKSIVSDIIEEGGHGVTATVCGKAIAVGNERLMNSLGIVPEKCTEDGTAIYVATDGEYSGFILIADVIKPQAKSAITDLKKAGIKKVIMLTGDNSNTADSVAKELGIDTVYSRLLPSDKVDIIEQLIKDGPLAFAGDGINDAPVLTRSDVGIAMGALGSDAAIEAADIVLMDDNPLKIATAIRISKKCMRITYQNIYISIGIKLACLVLGALGITNMWFAIFADVGVMVLAVLNSLKNLKRSA